MQRDSAEKLLRAVLDDKNHLIEDLTAKVKKYEEMECRWLETEKSMHQQHVQEVSDLKEQLVELQEANDSL